jgi:hypothetical protein
MKLESLYSPQWIKPDLGEENAEIVGAADDLGLDYHDVFKALQIGKLIPLTDDIWSVMLNTDSWGLQQGDITAAQELADYYGRDINKIISGIKSGVKMPSPIVCFVNGCYYLFGGNTRLMVSKILGVRPKILFADLSNLKFQGHKVQ